MDRRSRVLGWFRRLLFYSRLDIEDTHAEHGPVDIRANCIWCLVGNVVKEYPFGMDRQIKRGTKHFKGLTKVYCIPLSGNTERIYAIGLHRKSRHFVCVIMPHKRISNWRVKKVYDPVVLEMLGQHGAFGKSEQDRLDILQLMEILKLNG